MAVRMKAWCGHDLEEHLLNTRSIVAGRWDSLPYKERVNQRLVNYEIEAVKAKLLRLKFDEEVVEMAAYLHDVGKATREFQRKLEGDCKHVTLKGHEVISAWVTFYAAYLKYRNCGEECARAHATLASVGVLLHHHGRRSIYEAVVGVKDVVENLTYKDVETMADLATKFSGVDREDLLSYLEHDFMRGDVFKFLDVLLGREDSKYGELVTYAVVLADHIDSYFFRADGRPTLVVRDFIL